MQKCAFKKKDSNIRNLAISGHYEKVIWNQFNALVIHLTQYAKLESWLKSYKSRGKDTSHGVHAFCPTRWTVRGEGLTAVINNHAGKAVTRHASNQCRWWTIVFSFKSGEDVFSLNNMTCTKQYALTEGPKRGRWGGVGVQNFQGTSQQTSWKL